MTRTQAHAKGLLTGCFLSLVLSGASLAAPAQGEDRDPPHAEALTLVEQGLALGDNSEAEAAFYIQALDIDPSYANAHFNLAYVRQSQDRLGEAIPSYRRNLALDPNRHDAHRNLAACMLNMYQDAGLYDARFHLNAAIELQQALPQSRRPADLTEQTQQLLALEERIRAIEQPVVYNAPPREVIIAVLSRAVTRGGQTLYEGPRLAVTLFTTGQSEPTAAETAWLAELAQALEAPELAQYGFIIEGHADSRGPAALNESIARQRAQVVYDQLVHHHDIAPARLEVQSFGENRPIQPNNSLANYRWNRRAEIVRRPAS